MTGLPCHLIFLFGWVRNGQVFVLVTLFWTASLLAFWGPFCISELVAVGKADVTRAALLRADIVLGLYIVDIVLDILLHRSKMD